MPNFFPITSPLAPPPVGPYSPGLKAGNMIFISGQIPINMETKKLAGTDIESQTEQVLKNIRFLIEAAGATMGHIVKVTIYLKDLEHFKAMNEVYAKHFVIDPPARACVEVSRLPYNCLVEMDAIAMFQPIQTAESAPSF